MIINIAILFFALAQRLPGLSFGNVAQYDSAYRRAVGVPIRGGFHPRPERRSIPAHHTQLACLRFIGLKEIFEEQVADVLVLIEDEP